MTMGQKKALHWKDRLKAGAIHLAISLLIGALAGLLVFGLWYPYPYRESSGGRELFLILVSVDVILGPLITLTVFNRAKPRGELVRDLAVVVLIQLAALAYGMWTVFVSRPVHLVFEYDRFRAVHAIEVPDELLNRAPADVRKMPVTGPTVLALRPFRDVNEEITATLMAVQGLPLSAHPELWQAYAQARQRALGAAKPMGELRRRFPQQEQLIDVAVEKTGQKADTLLYLPMIVREAVWTVLIDAGSADVRGFVPLNSF